MERLFHLHFDYSPQLPRKARHAIKTLLLHSPLSLPEKNKVLLAISELTANLLRHSEQKPNQINLECSWCHQYFNLKLRDNGSALPDKEPILDLEQILENDPQTSGYGLAMLQSEFDYINYSRLPSGLNQWFLQLILEPQILQKNILLVDDDPIQLQMLQLYLEPHNITAYSSPLAAIDWLKKNQPDLIISDIRMPELDGLRFRQRVSDLPHLQLTPFIFLTGDDDESLAHNVTNNDIDDFILKPINREQIKRISDRVLKRSTALMQRTHSLIDRELKHHLRKQVSNNPNDLYQICTLSYSAHLGGGDYWLIDSDEQQLQIILADVMGHDIEACFMAGRQQGFFHALTHQNKYPSPYQSHITDRDSPINKPTPVASKELMGKQLLARFSHWLDLNQPELLTTLQLLLSDKSEGQDQLLFYNAGSPPPWLLTAEGTIASLPQTGSLPGLSSHTEFSPFKFQLQAGERLILFSDGLIEISNDYAVQSQQIKRLLGLLMDNAQQPLQVLADLLALEIEKQEINDDISVILLEKNI